MLLFQSPLPMGAAPIFILLLPPSFIAENEKAYKTMTYDSTSNMPMSYKTFGRIRKKGKSVQEHPPFTEFGNLYRECNRGPNCNPGWWWNSVHRVRFMTESWQNQLIDQVWFHSDCDESEPRPWSDRPPHALRQLYSNSREQEKGRDLKAAYIPRDADRGRADGADRDRLGPDQTAGTLQRKENRSSAFLLSVFLER